METSCKDPGSIRNAVSDIGGASASDKTKTESDALVIKDVRADERVYLLTGGRVYLVPRARCRCSLLVVC